MKQKNDGSDRERFGHCLMVAAFRAIESERKDALFRDVLARKLSGDKGARLVAATPMRLRKIMAYVIAVRTVAIDGLIEKVLAMNTDMVVNLGAGLDARPYRLSLPATLKWVEVDFGTIMDYKNEMLKDQTPRCQLQRIAANLSDTFERERIFSQLAGEGRKALVITEGVIPYLSNEDAAALAESMHQFPSFHYWIQDYQQGKQAAQNNARELRQILANAPFKFKEQYPLEFFGRLGWKVIDKLYMLDEGKRLGCPSPLPFPWNVLFSLSAKIADSAKEAYGYALFERV